MESPRFRLRSGAPAWGKICAVDVDAVVEGGRAASILSDLVDDLSFSKVTAAELRRVGFDASEIMVRLLQLAVEYLLHVQNALGDAAVAAEAAAARARDDARRFDAERKLADARRKSGARHAAQLRDVALAIAGAARAAGVDTARWLRALDDEDAHAARLVRVALRRPDGAPAAATLRCRPLARVRLDIFEGIRIYILNILYQK